MAKQKRWNNQGGSGRGDKPKQEKKSIPNIPSFDKLPESNLVSFRLLQPRRSQPDYGQDGDGFYDEWQLLDGSLFDTFDTFDESIEGELPEIKDVDLEFSIENKIRDPILTIDNFTSEDAGKNLLPKEAYKEYEIVVKFKTLILTILSGQAYAARNGLNSPLLDFSIVITSSEPIAIAPNPAGTLNIIQRVGSAQDPMFAVYNWVLDKLKLVTNNDGKGTDDTLRRLPRRGVLPIPRTSFNWNGDTWNLFNSTGKEPTQICLHATNDVVKFEPSTPKNAAFLWSVLNCNDPLPLCKSLIPTVSIALAPGSASELEAGSGLSFVLRISIDDKIDEDLDVIYQIISSIDPANYTIVGVDVDIDNNPIVTIPANADYIDISIEPLANPTETESKTIVFKLDESSNDLYFLDTDTVELTIDPQPTPIIPVISFVTGTITNTPTSGRYSLAVSITPPFAPVLYNIILQRQDTINITFISNNVSTVVNSVNTITIPVGSSQSIFNIDSGSINNWRITRVRSTFTRVADSTPGGAIDKTEGVDFNYGIKSIDITP